MAAVSSSHKVPAASPRVYLDTNAVGNLIDQKGWKGPEPLQEVRDRLVERIRSHQFEVVTSAWVVLELTGISWRSSEEYQQGMSLLWDLAGSNWLLDTDHLAREEVAVGRKLRGFEPFETWKNWCKARRVSMELSSAEEIAQDVRMQVDRIKREEESLRGWILHQLQWDGTSRHKVKEWCAETQIAESVNEHLRSSSAMLGLPDDRSKWPEPRSIPTLWNFYEYKMARIYLNYGQGRRIDASDMYDIHHYAAAGYADIMVSDDGGFQETCNSIPGKPFELVNLENFIRSHVRGGG